MGVVYNFDSLAKVLEFAEPTVYNGSWEVIKGGLISSGEIAESAGVVQKVVTINEAASSTATAGETLSALCAMEVSESTVAGATVTTLTPKAAVTFTPKTVALCGIAGALGLDFGFRIGQNIANLYFGDEWDWHAPGIYDVAKDAIRTYVKADGTTYYDEETVNAFANRLNEIGAFNDGSYEIKGLQVGTRQYFSGINFNYEQYENVLLNVMEHYRNWRGNEDFLKTLINIEAVPSSNWMQIEVYNVESWAISENDLLSGVSTLDMLNEVLIANKGYNTINNNEIKYVTNTDNIKWKDDNMFFDRITVTNINGLTGSIKIKRYQNSSSYNSEGIHIRGGESRGIYTFINLGEQVNGSLPDVSKQQDATVPTTFPLEIPETYPTWQPSPINKPDGANQTYPVEMPDTDPLSEKATKHQNDAQKGINQNPENNPVIGSAIGIVPEILPNIPTPQVPTIDDGDTPIPIIPAIGVQGTGFVALYNPTQNQLSAFSQYLWSNDFIENFKKLFSNPMDAIIGLHLIYATPSRGNVAEIVCGYSHSGVMSNTVNNQYIEIDCGSIKVNRYFGNVLDYAPYTKLQVYLPFVGIVDLDTNEIMDGTLNIKYRIDVLTGSCLARLKITRGDYNAELYNFAGNCAVQLPISGGSYSGIIANAIGVAGSLGATIATGGAMAPVLVGSVVSSAVNSRTNVSHSGSLGSNAGALGIMKPYLIITRPKPAEANYFNEFYGRPSNKTVKLSSCSGFTRVKDVHIERINATDDELSNIENLLKEGVII